MLRLKLDNQAADPATTTAQEELWTHGMAVSQIGEVLAAKYGADRQMCSTLGLLHDLGKLVVLRGPQNLRDDLAKPGPGPARARSPASAACWAPTTPTSGRTSPGCGSCRRTLWRASASTTART